MPVFAGYIGIGLPCGIMEQQAGLSALQAFITSVLLYAGAGQFMLAGMWISGTPIATIAASISAVNLRQILYSASLSKYCRSVSKRLAFAYSASVTDETFGVNIQRFESGNWKVSQALLVNAFSCVGWASANAVGVLLGEVVSIPVSIGSFAMTSIFICLLLTQKMTKVNIVVSVAAFLGVVICKLVGLSSVAIVVGAVIGVACGLGYMHYSRRGADEHE